MSGTLEGGKKTAATNKKRYGKDYYVKLGRLGRAASSSAGFRDRELAVRAGRLGGLKSRKKGAKNVITNHDISS